MPIYDYDGHRRFHYILSRLFRQLYLSYRAVASELDFSGRVSHKNTIRATIENCKHALKERSENTVRCSQLLDIFVSLFEVSPQGQNPLFTHVAWLYQMSENADREDVTVRQVLDRLDERVEISPSHACRLDKLPDG